VHAAQETPEVVSYEFAVEATTHPNPELNAKVIEQLAYFMMSSAVDSEPTALIMGFARNSEDEPMNIMVKMRSILALEDANEKVKQLIYFAARPGNAQALALCIKTLLNDPQAIEKYQEYCTMLKEEYNFPIEDVVAFYRQVLMQVNKLDLHVAVSPAANAIESNN
jgi:hypothetical protein